MLYHYKRPGDWLWTPFETRSLAAEVRRRKLRPEWKYRSEADLGVHSLAELLEAERARQARPLTPREEEMLAPDGTWGWIVVVGCSLLLLAALFVPSREGASPSSRYSLAGIALAGIGWGVQQIQASRAWKARRGPKA